MRNIYLVLLIFFPSVFLIAQEKKSEVKKIELLLNNGSRVINKVLTIGNDGYLWYSTNKGLVKDFGNTQQFFSNDIEGAPLDYEANEIIEDENGRILLGTTNGLFVLDYINDKRKWIKPTHTSDETIASFENFLIGKNGQVVVGTDIGEILILHKNDSLVAVNLQIENEDLNKILPPTKLLKILDDGSIIATYNNRIFRINNSSVETIFDARSWLDSETSENSYVLVDNGKMFRASSSGNYTFNNTSYQYAYLPEINYHLVKTPNDSWETIKNQDEYLSKSIDVSRLFLAFNTTKNGLLEEFIIEQIDDQYVAFLFESAELGDLVKDFTYKINSTLWVSTRTDIYKLKRPSSGFEDILTKKITDFDNPISAREIVADSLGNLYVGSNSNLFKVNATTQKGKSLELENLLKSNNIQNTYRSIYLENNYTLWNVGESRFLHRVDLNSKTIENFEFNADDDLENLMFLKIERYNDNEFILGSNKGLWLFNLKTKDFSRFNCGKFQSTIDELTIAEIVIDSNNLWMATRTNGFYHKKISTTEIKHYSTGNDSSLIDKRILALSLDDKAKALYIGTESGLEVLNLETDKITHIDIVKGKKSHNVSSIIPTDSRIWLGTYEGLFCLEKSSNKIIQFNTADGLPFNEFNMQSSFKSDDGTLIFGGIDGLIKVYPNLVFDYSETPNLNLVSLEYYSRDNDSIHIATNGYSINELSMDLNALDYDFNDENIDAYSFNLPYNNNYFNANFAINDLFEFDKNKFLVKRYGQSEMDWYELNSSGELRTFDLATGSNAFLVKGIDASGNETQNKILLIANVRQVFYKTWWFFTLIGIAVLSFILWRVLENRARLKRKEQHNIRRIKLESRALRAQMNPHFISNALNGLQSVMILKGERKANEYLATFSTLLRSMIKIGHDETLSLAEEIKYLKAYLKLEKFRQPHLDYEVISEDDLELDSLNIPCFIFQPIVENSIIHGLLPKTEGPYKVSVKFYVENESLVGEVIDNGIGRKASEELKLKNNKFQKKSWSTTILKERINIINYLTNKQVYYKIIDLVEEKRVLGTKVIVKLPLD